MWKKVFQYFLRRFQMANGRSPMTAAEMNQIQSEAVNWINKTKGQRLPGTPEPTQPPFQGWTPKVIEGGKGKEGIEKIDIGEVIPKETPLTKDKSFRIKQGLSTQIKLNTLPQNKQLAKEFVTRKNAEFNSLDRKGQIEILERLNIRIKNEQSSFATPVKPEDMASGGIARVGMFKGGSIWKEFIERLFIKASNDIRQGKGKWAGLTQDQWIKQHDDLTKMIKKWEWGGKKGLPQGAEQFIGMNDLQVTKAIKAAKAKATGKLPQKAEVEAQRQEQIMEEAYEEIRGGSGFTGDDLKYDADILAESLAKVQGKDYATLGADEVSNLYSQAYKRVSQDFLKKRQAEKALKDLDQKIELQMFDPKDRLPNASGGIAGELHLNEGGRVPMIFGGSAGLRAMWKQMMKGISERRGGKPVKRLFPGLTQEEKRIEKVVLGTPEHKAFEAIEQEHKLEGIDLLINRLKHDKKILEQQAKNKALKDPNLDFLMEKMETVMPEVYGPHLKKYTDIDKDILQLETIKKNLIMKDRKLNAEGGLAHVLGV